MSQEARFIEAAKDGDYDTVNELLRESVDVNAQSGLGRAPLYWTCLKNHGDIVRQLLANPRIDVNLQNRDGAIPLYWACCMDFVDIVERLLTHPRINVNLQNQHGETSLYWACYQGHVAVVELLLAHGANPYIKDTESRTALDIATEMESQEIITQLEGIIKAEAQEIGAYAEAVVEYKLPREIESLGTEFLSFAGPRILKDIWQARTQSTTSEPSVPDDSAPEPQNRYCIL